MPINRHLIMQDKRPYCQACEFLSTTQLLSTSDPLIHFCSSCLKGYFIEAISDDSRIAKRIMHVFYLCDPGALIPTECYEKRGKRYPFEYDHTYMTGNLKIKNPMTPYEEYDQLRHDLRIVLVPLLKLARDAMQRRIEEAASAPCSHCHERQERARLEATATLASLVEKTNKLAKSCNYLLPSINIEP